MSEGQFQSDMYHQYVIALENALEKNTKRFVKLGINYINIDDISRVSDHRDADGCASINFKGMNSSWGLTITPEEFEILKPYLESDA